MFNALYTKLPNAGRTACPTRRAQNKRWLTDLPSDLKKLVVPSTPHWMKAPPPVASPPLSLFPDIVVSVTVIVATVTSPV